MVKPENYISIQGWMVTDLKLSGNELLCYALIYGFCQDEESCFTGSSQYIADWLNISKRSVLTILGNLTKKGLIKKIEKNIRNVKFCDYKTSPLDKKFLLGCEKTSLGGGEKTSPHNIDKHNIDNNNKEIYKEKFDFGPFSESMEKWIKYRRQNGKKMREMAVGTAFKRLKTISYGDPGIAMEIVDNAICNDWQQIYPLKHEFGTNEQGIPY